MEEIRVTAIVVAAGSSTRMGFDKLFYPLKGLPVLEHSIRALEAHPQISQIVLVAGANLEKVQQLAQNRKKPTVVVPGGIGTFEELFEVMTLKQLGRMDKPIAIYNFQNYYDELEHMIFCSMKRRFIKANCRMLYLLSTDREELFDYMENLPPLGLSVHQLKDG